MSEEVALAVGAAAPGTTKIGEKVCAIRPLGLRGLVEIERECLAQFQRQYVKSVASNLEFLPPDKQESAMLKTLDAVARWDIDSLPPKMSHDPLRIKLSVAAKQWLADHWEVEPDDPEMRSRRLMAASLDQGMLSEDDYRGLTGTPSPKVRVPYVSWWVTGSYDGMITLIWKAFESQGVTRDDVVDAIGTNITKLNELARDIEKAGTPSVGNG